MAITIEYEIESDKELEGKMGNLSKKELPYLYKVSLILNGLLFPFSANAEMSDGERALASAEPTVYAKQQADKYAMHKGKQTSLYKSRYDVLVDLTKIGSVDESIDFSTRLSIEQQDDIFLRIAERLPAGTDFSISRTEVKKNDVALVVIGLPTGVEKFELAEGDFILNINTTFVGGLGTGLKRGLADYAKSNHWTKEKGLDVLEDLFLNGRPIQEATIFFDSLDGFKEVMMLMRGNSVYLTPITLSETSFAIGTYLEVKDIQRLRGHSSVLNVIPNEELYTN